MEPQRIGPNIVTYFNIMFVSDALLKVRNTILTSFRALLIIFLALDVR
jgi:hypothetical protein